MGRPAILFFFYTSGDPRDLHSFPTRRSSDLPSGSRQGVDELRRRLEPVCGQLGQCLQDRKSTRLNSSHVAISYAVFCLKKKNILIVYKLQSALCRDEAPSHHTTARHA